MGFLVVLSVCVEIFPIAGAHARACAAIKLNLSDRTWVQAKKTQ